jgi:hypothetical protein
MASPGTPITRQVTVNAPADEIIRRITGMIPAASGGHFDGTTVTSDGVSTRLLNRGATPFLG